jgi:hypothetical protein
MSALQLAVRGVMVVVRKRPDLVLQVLYSDVQSIPFPKTPLSCPFLSCPLLS